FDSSALLLGRLTARCPQPRTRSSSRKPSRWANRSPAPRRHCPTLRDLEMKRPEFAIESGTARAALAEEGYGYEITGLDVLNAYSHTMKAAENAGCAQATRERIQRLVARECSK